MQPFSVGHGLHIDPLFDPELETSWSADLDRESGKPYFSSFTVGRVLLAYKSGLEAFTRAVRGPGGG